MLKSRITTSEKLNYDLRQLLKWEKGQRERVKKKRHEESGEVQWKVHLWITSVPEEKTRISGKRILFQETVSWGHKTFLGRKLTSIIVERIHLL